MNDFSISKNQIKQQHNKPFAFIFWGLDEKTCVQGNDLMHFISFITLTNCHKMTNCSWTGLGLQFLTEGAYLSRILSTNKSRWDTFECKKNDLQLEATDQKVDFELQICFSQDNYSIIGEDFWVRYRKPLTRGSYIKVFVF